LPCKAAMGYAFLASQLGPTRLATQATNQASSWNFESHDVTVVGAVVIGLSIEWRARQAACGRADGPLRARPGTSHRAAGMLAPVSAADRLRSRPRSADSSAALGRPFAAELKFARLRDLCRASATADGARGVALRSRSARDMGLRIGTVPERGGARALGAVASRATNSVALGPERNSSSPRTPAKNGAANQQSRSGFSAGSGLRDGAACGGRCEVSWPARSVIADRHAGLSRAHAIERTDDTPRLRLHHEIRRFQLDA